MNAQPQKNPYAKLVGKQALICVPSGRAVEAHFSFSLAGITSYTGLHGVRLGIMNEIRSVISSSRNHLVQRAVPAKPDFLLFLDSDMIFPPDTLLRLMSHDKDIVCATYNRRSPPYSILGHLIGPPKDIRGGVHEADFMPGGVMCIKYSVLEKLRYPWFFETYDWDGETPQESFMRMLIDWSYIDMPLAVRAEIAGSPAFGAWLNDNRELMQSSMQTDNRMITEDYNFCRKARKAGFKIFCDFDLSFQVGHIGEQVITLEPPPEPAPAPIPSIPAEPVDAGAP